MKFSKILVLGFKSLSISPFNILTLQVISSFWLIRRKVTVRPRHRSRVGLKAAKGRRSEACSGEVGAEAEGVLTIPREHLCFANGCKAKCYLICFLQDKLNTPLLPATNTGRRWLLSTQDEKQCSRQTMHYHRRPHPHYGVGAAQPPEECQALQGIWAQPT